MIEVDFHCTRCGACPDEPCRQRDGRSVPPHAERRKLASAGESVRSDALALVDELTRHADLAAEEEANSWIVTSVDMATEKIGTVFGPFDSREDAQMWADEHETSVNEGFSENDTPPWNVGWKVTVHPMVDPQS